MRTENQATNLIGAAYEKTDANPRALRLFAIGMIVMLVVTYVAMVATFRYFERTQSLGQPSSAFAPERVLPPMPRLQADPKQDLKRFRAEEADDLNSYGWVNPKAGIVKIPIDRAMDRLLEKGLPVRGATSESNQAGK